MAESTVLVTGGAGYIGSWLTRLLLQDGYKVHVLDNLMFGGRALVDVFEHPNLTFQQGDIREAQDRQQALTGVDAVVHLAAIVGDPACKKEPELASETNQTASETLYQESVAAGVKQFVFASTCSNYGKMADPEAYLNEESELRPVSLYAELKVAFEKYLLGAQTADGPTTTVMRFSTVYGFSPRVRFDLTVNEFTKDVALGKELVIYGEQFWRPYCHVADLARSVVHVLKAPREKVHREVFGVGDTRENYTKKMLVDEIMKVYPNMNVSFVEKNEDPRDYRVNFDKIKRELGFEITRDVPQGVREIAALVESGILGDYDSMEFRNS